MKIIYTIAECRAERAKLGRLAFVPTMGALHDGHISLIDIAKKHAPHTAVSIFVNPTQFGPNEDFHKYPRPIERDLEMCEKAGVNLVFNPSPAEMYRPDIPELSIDLTQLTTVLEGAHRPGHFRGVCQVVAKLFNIVQPQVACFGQKDFQQLRILTAMVEALDFPIEIIPCPTLRDPDGLAMSSRNQYLSPQDRQRALSISRSLFWARNQIQNEIHNTDQILSAMRQMLLDQNLQIDYVAAVDPLTLQPIQQISGPITFAIAARAGTTRLIDNLTISPA